MMKDVGFHSAASCYVCLGVCISCGQAQMQINFGKGNLAFSYKRESLGKLSGTWMVHEATRRETNSVFHQRLRNGRGCEMERIIAEHIRGCVLFHNGSLQPRSLTQALPLTGCYILQQ